MMPLRVEAKLAGPICLPNGPIALDALLMYAVVLRDDIPPAATAAECVPIEIPIEVRDGIHMASCGVFEVETRETSFTNRRFPLAEAQEFAEPSFKRIQITAGPAKSYRLPREHLYLVYDRITWWAIGDEEGVRALLCEWIAYLGKRRAVGLGKVREWTIEPCESWGEVFPVIRDGKPLRTLPVASAWATRYACDVETAYAVPTPPYWDNSRRELCAVPSWR